MWLLVGGGGGKVDISMVGEIFRSVQEKTGAQRVIRHDSFLKTVCNIFPSQTILLTYQCVMSLTIQILVRISLVIVVIHIIA